MRCDARAEARGTPRGTIRRFAIRPGTSVQRRGIRHPARLVPLAFLALIALGTLLLMLPFARTGEGSAPFMTALFTATSAACVTGLVVVDTATYWSPFGQAVIMLLFQVGGFGIMAGTTLVILLVSQRLRLRTRLIAQAETRSASIGDVGEVIRLVVGVTLAVEAVLTAWFALRLYFGYGESIGGALWHGLFHALSAFNNAGFTTYPDGLMRFRADASVMVPLTLAIILGGLGVPVLRELWCGPRRWARWSVHTKITLLGSAVLLAVGFIGIYAWEMANPATLGGMATGERILAVALQSASMRSAGFSTLDTGAMTPQSLLLHYVLMFIGGGSASTAGGIRVTTFFLLGFVVWSEIRGTAGTSVFRRHICPTVQRQALSIALIAIGVVGLGTLALLSTTPLRMQDALFEVVSASATVGLSTGITPALPESGQWVLIVLMYLGRVGTITVFTALALRGRPPEFRYPEERPIVG